jgi:hypothetical protein
MELKSVGSQLYLIFKILESVSVLMLALWLVFLKIQINKKQGRKMCMTEIENRDSLTDKQTMGDELNETR